MFSCPLFYFDKYEKECCPELKKTPTVTQNSLFVPPYLAVNDVLMSDLLNFRQQKTPHCGVFAFSSI